MNQRVLLACMLLVCLLGTACAKKQESTLVRAQYYPTCQEPLAYLHDRGKGAAVRGAASGAIQGGVISGIAAGIIGAITGGFDPASMLVSVGVGSALGGTVGAVNSHQAVQRDETQHLARYLEQIDGDIHDMDIVQAAATVSMQCYGREFKSLLTGVRSGEYDRQAADARLSEIIAGREEAARLLKTNPDVAQYQQEFASAWHTPAGKGAK